MTNSIENKKTIDFDERGLEYIVSIPHSGVMIPVNVKDSYNIGKHFVIGADLFTDILFDTGLGIKIVSNLSRFVVNMSRFRNGNKSLPLHMQADPLHELPFTDDDILIKEHSFEEQERLFGIYDEYHALLSKSIKQMGQALVFDCHSMCSIGPKNAPDAGSERPDFIIGTNNEKSVSAEISDKFTAVFKREASKHGLSVEKNHIYTGGFITQKYGNGDGVNVIQIEVNKKNYMDENTFELDSEKFKIVKNIISKSFRSVQNGFK